MDRNIDIDVVMGDVSLFRYSANHVPCAGDTLSGVIGVAKGLYIIEEVDHCISSSTVCAPYCSLVTLTVRLSNRIR